jgi:hypothetical protein
MMPDNKISYLDLCIASLPPEKREAALDAFYEISETGDDSYLSKLLVILEANGAYAKRIPKEMTEAGAKVIDGIHMVLNQLGEAEAYRRQLFKDTIANETGRLANSMPVREINDRLDCLKGLLAEMRKAAERIESGISSGLAVFLVILAFGFGAALPVWRYWTPYQVAQQNKKFYDSASAAGIHMQVVETATGNRLMFVGPAIQSITWRKDASGQSYGADVDFADPK